MTGGSQLTLTGHLDTFAEKFAIERALRRVAGVKAIALELDVKLAPQHKRSDTDIAAAIEQALRWNTLVPMDQVRVTVENGWITLQGEVEWDFQRQAVYKTIRPLIGVVGISNEITLKTKPVPANISSRIAEALKRYGMILADNGSPWYISGASDPRFDDDVMHELDVITGRHLEVVDTSGLVNGG